MSLLSIFWSLVTLILVNLVGCKKIIVCSLSTMIIILKTISLVISLLGLSRILVAKDIFVLIATRLGSNLMSKCLKHYENFSYSIPRNFYSTNEIVKSLLEGIKDFSSIFISVYVTTLSILCDLFNLNHSQIQNKKLSYRV